MGIWIPRDDMDGGSEQESVDDNENENDKDSIGSEESELDGNEDGNEDGEGGKLAGIGRFDALAMNESDGEQDESDGEM